MNVTTLELTAADFEAEFGDELPARDLLTCIPVLTIVTIVGGLSLVSASEICVP